MDIPKNQFKAKLGTGVHQVGIWNSMSGNTVTEALATCGFDWICLDTEHSATEVKDVLLGLQAIEAYPETSAIVRPVENNAALIKRHLDQGAQTLVLPYVQNPDEAKYAVEAMRYPPRGMRGVAGATRATRFGTVKDYATRAEEELCLVVQVETTEAMEHLEDIATTDGVDAVFIGPSDLAASMGYPGQPNHPDVFAAVESAFARLRKVDVPFGHLTLNADFARHCLSLGTSFTAVSTDISLMTASARALSASFK